MRTRLAIIFLLFTFLLPCLALCEELPDAVLTLCQDAYPGYEAAMFDGWDGGEYGGQYAVLMHSDDTQDNALLIVERAAGESDYAITVDAPNAVRDGVLPDSLYIDNLDVLFYTYGNDTYHTEKTGGVWQHISTIYGYYPERGQRYSVTSGIADGKLAFTKYIEDENENVLDTIQYPPIPAGDAFESRMLPANFDIERFILDPADGVNVSADMCGGFLSDGETLQNIDLKPDALAMAVETADGKHCIRVCEWNGSAYTRTYESAPYAGEIALDAFHAGDDQLSVSLDFSDYLTLVRTDGGFQLSSFSINNAETFYFMPDGIFDSASYTFGRNDGAIYGDLPGLSLDSLDFAAIKSCLDDPAAMIDGSSYALVSNPDPADRLHLRAKPDKSSASLGKFYNRTPVRILERQGDWTRVRIGCGGHVLEGWMMTEFLAFDTSEKAALACAFPQLFFTDVYYSGGVPLLKSPDGKSTGLTASPETMIFVLGVVGDDWYIVQLRDGSVGYIPQSVLFEGNG